jgi:hypothetical protein
MYTETKYRKLHISHFYIKKALKMYEKDARENQLQESLRTFKNNFFIFKLFLRTPNKRFS